MKKLISMILTLTMILSLVAINVSALAVDDYSYDLYATAEEGKSLTDIKAGDKITVSVAVTTSEGMSGADVIVKYDKDLFACAAPTISRGKITNFGGLSETWYNEYNALDDYAKFISGTCTWVFNEDTGTAGVQGIVKDGESVWPEDAVENLVVFECILTAETDITEETEIYLSDATFVIAFIDGKTTSIARTDSEIIGGVSATATPKPTEAPALVDTTVPSNNVTSAVVAEKSFVAFAKFANIDVNDASVEEYGIMVAGGATVDEAAAKAGTAYKAEGVLADGTFAVKLINGEGSVDYFDYDAIGFIPYLKVNGTTFYGAYSILK